MRLRVSRLAGTRDARQAGIESVWQREDRAPQAPPKEGAARSFGSTFVRHIAVQNRLAGAKAAWGWRAVKARRRHGAGVSRFVTARQRDRQRLVPKESCTQLWCMFMEHI